MKKILLLLFLHLQVVALAQPVNKQYGEDCPKITYALLPDSDYSLLDVRNNNKLLFVAGGSVNIASSPVCWVRITIASFNKSAKAYSLSITPAVINTFYYFDVEAHQWLGQSAGILSLPVSGRKIDGAVTVLLQPGVDTVYAKMDMAAIRKFSCTIKPAINIEQQDVADKRQKLLLVGWLVSVCVLFVFFVNNAYLYYSFRDKAVLFYLLVYAGAMLYLSCYRGVFAVKVFSMWPTGGIGLLRP